MRDRRGFTLIELMIVVAILAILASVLLPHVTAGRQVAESAGDQATLRWHYQALTQMKDRRYPFPPGGGAKLVLSTWTMGVVEHTSQNRDRYFSQAGISSNARRMELAELDPKEIWKDLSEIGPDDTSFFGRSSAHYGDMWRGDAVIMAVTGYLDAHVNVLLGDGTVQEWHRYGPELRKIWPDGAEYFPIGPGSPHPELAKLTQ